MSGSGDASLPAGVAFIGCGPAGAPVEPPAAIGYKAHNLARMAALGLPVPPGFVLGTRWCARPAEVTPALWQPALAAVEQAAGLRYGDPRRPLLVSVRSGAPASMPGMLETLLNIGLTDATLPGLLRHTGNPRLVWDAYRRLIAGYGEIVLGVPAAAFAADLAAFGAGIDEHDLDFIALRELARRHQATCRREAGASLPQDPLEQLQHAIAAVFASWHAGKARAYRAMKGLADDPGTAVAVQRMVFGNAGGMSGAGVGFTRNPASGAAELWVDFLFNAQGEDVVSGRRRAPDHDELARVAPAVWSALRDAAHRLEAAFRDMQDFEFTVEDGTLYLLQTRDGKRTPQAAARIALDLADEGLTSATEARRRVAGLNEADLAVERVVAADGVVPEPLAWGTSASHGVATGEIVLDEQHARARQAAGVPVVLLRQDAETRDIAAIECAAGLLTARGARTSHAAVVARQLGKVCLVGCDALRIDLARRSVQLGETALIEGDVLTIDGNTGAVYAGRVRTVREAPPELLARLAALRS